VETDRQQASAPPIGEEPEVADAHEATREHMKQKTSQELIDGQRHQLLLVAMCRVTPAKGDVAVFQPNEPVVGDGYAMSVSP
jgi:hypothetical protein